MSVGFNDSSLPAQVAQRDLTRIRSRCRRTTTPGAPSADAREASPPTSRIDSIIDPGVRGGSPRTTPPSASTSPPAPAKNQPTWSVTSLRWGQIKPAQPPARHTCWGQISRHTGANFTQTSGRASKARVRWTIYSLATPEPESPAGASPFRPRLRLPSVKAAWWPQRHRTRVERGTGNERLGSALSWLIGGGLAQ